MRKPSTLALGLTILGLAATAARAQSLRSGEVVSTITARTLDPPNPAYGADGLTHLAYEIFVTNPSKFFVTLNTVEAVDEAGHTLGSLSGPALAKMTHLYAGKDTALAPGGVGLIFMDTRFAAGAALPSAIAARISFTRQAEGPDGKPIPMPAGSPFVGDATFTGARTTVGRPGIVIDPPLRGGRWVVVNGCCDAVTSHRGAVIPVNGAPRVPERFAIDWVQLDDANRLFTGDRAALKSYAYFGTPVHAVADGTVVNLYDQAAEQVPGQPAKGITPENLGGNMLVIDIGGGNFAFFAHLQPGSLRVKLGDKVHRGDVIALLGNTGNTDAPHLHFHVMDGPSPIDANGLPYAFSHFTGAGMLDEASGDALFEKGAPGVVKPSPLDGPHVNQLPLNDEVVDFGG